MLTTTSHRSGATYLSPPDRPRRTTGSDRRTLHRLTAVLVAAAAIGAGTALPAAGAVEPDPVPKAQVEHAERMQQAAAATAGSGSAYAEPHEGLARLSLPQPATTVPKAQLEYLERRAVAAEWQRVNKAQVEHQELLAQRREDQAGPDPSATATPLVTGDEVVLVVALLTATAAGGVGIVAVRRSHSAPRAV